MIIIPLVVGNLATNCYVVGDPETKKGIIIDPGGDAEQIMNAVQRAGLDIVAIVDTHGHFDHVMANEVVQELTGAPIAIHPADAPMLTDPKKGFGMFAMFFGNLPGGPPAEVLLNDGDEVRFGNQALKVVHTPGHSQGSISLVGDDVVFSGDALFQRSIGRTDFPGGDHHQLIDSIRRHILTLPDDTVVYSGHGPETTVGDEKRYNPFVRGA
ncbi:MAG: MBL fold metallo-hydrolase [Chloroflexi bacterium]|nr:MBL fold metallo-hydrolase [Chloroflexota bacterium]MBU1749420.1 MBL fold metallo-hydrolase [Chloroflexota bacterium]